MGSAEQSHTAVTSAKHFIGIVAKNVTPSSTLEMSVLDDGNIGITFTTGPKLKQIAVSHEIIKQAKADVKLPQAVQNSIDKTMTFDQVSPLIDAVNKIADAAADFGACIEPPKKPINVSYLIRSGGSEVLAAG